MSQLLYLRPFSTHTSYLRSSWQAILNYKYIYQNAEAVQRNCINRNLQAIAETVPKIRSLIDEKESLKNEFFPLLSLKKEITLQIERCSDPNERGKLVNEAKVLKKKTEEYNKIISKVTNDLYQYCLAVPNTTLPTVPVGPEDKAVVVQKIGSPLVKKTGSLKDHLQIANEGINLEDAAQASGHSFCYTTGDIALLEMAITNYAMDFAISKGWCPVIPPTIVRTDIALACGFQPRDEEGQQIYELDSYTSPLVSSPKQCLIGTAEISLAALGFKKTFNNFTERKVVGVSRAYRREAGARGKENRGLYRLHEFTKVELFAWTHPSRSSEMFNEIVNFQKEFVETLKIPARILNMPTAELGSSASQKYDIEAWMPARQSYGEITSASNCLEYQARRLLTRYRNDKDSGFVHTLNGTAAAIPRLIIAILENHQQEDGTIKVPETLVPYIHKEYLFKAK